MAKPLKKTRLDRALSQVPTWAQGTIENEDFYLSNPSMNGIELYLTGKDNIASMFDTLFQMGMGDVGRSLLAAHAYDRVQANNSMAQAISRIIHAQSFSIFFARKIGNTIIGSLDDLMRDVFIAIAMGLPELAQKFYRVIREALEGGYTVRDGHRNIYPDTLRYSAMVMSILNDWQEFPAPDLDKLGLPRDPAWGYLVSCWSDPDADRLLPILNSACDVHVERIGLSARDTDSGQYEFCSIFWAVHPAEILAVMRLRDMLGLANPQLEHPLMNTPYAQITRLPGGSILPQDTVLESVLKMAQQRDPEMMAQWDNA